MSLSYSLFKNVLRKSIIDSIYNGVISKTERYYHWLGKENSWEDFLSPFIPSSLTDLPGPPQNNFRYDLHVRRDILTAKAISAADVSYVIPRIDWKLNNVYDIYDDAYTAPIAQAIPWQANISVSTEQIIKQGSIYYIVLQSGTTDLSTAPTHVTGIADNGSAKLKYLTRDTFAASGAVSLETSQFYVLTSEFNVYKCIWNNNNSASTVMPTTTPSNALVNTADGYKWKFMYTIPVSLRNRFLSTEWMPVTTALKSTFYSNGEITSYTIENPGSGYASTDKILVTGNGFLAENPYIVSSITIVDGGLGYTSAPAITFGAPMLPGVVATGTVTISSPDGIIDEATLGLPGYGYDREVAITVAAPIAFNALWIAGSSVSVNNIIKRNVTVTPVTGLPYQQEIYYKVTIEGGAANGSLGTLAPEHTTGSVANGGVNLLVVAKGAVLNAVITQTKALLTPQYSELGEVTGIIIQDGGIGYTEANATFVNVNGGAPSGTGADIRFNFSPGDVNTLQSAVETDAISGTIEVIEVVDEGVGYSTADIEILGDGTGATAVAVVTSGRITEIIVTNVGQNYTWTDVRITGTGTGASARAIMSPINGHGFNAIDELNANSLMFYSSISKDKNQGLFINNDYRKAGLIKNLKQFDTGLLFKEDIGSGCVLIEGDFISSKLTADLLLQKDGYKNYRIVEFNDTQILLSVFNNFSLNIGEKLTVAEDTVSSLGYEFRVTKVTERTIDQFSGDLLFFSVRERFSPSDEQIFTLRTVITI